MYYLFVHLFILTNILVDIYNNNLSEMENKPKEFDYMFKLILLGSTAVGKSNILLRFIKNDFSQESQTTLGVEYAAKIVTTQTGKRVKLQIWDTAGQERYGYFFRYLDL